MKHVRKLGVGAAALVAALGLTSLAPAEVQAADCGARGKRINSFPINSPTRGEQIGALDVYYSRSNGGTNTACLHHRGRTWGEGLETSVSIRRCDSYYNCNSTGQAVSDEGRYAYYAGPVSVSNTRRNCVSVRGILEDRYSNIRTLVIADQLGCAATPEVKYRTYDPNASDCRPNEPC